MKPLTFRPFDVSDGLMALFLAAMIVVWTALMGISHSAPDLHGMEALVRGVSLEWGYAEHPPLPSWVFYGLTQLFGRPLWLPFFAGMCSSMAALWFVWLLGREFASSAKAAVGVLLVSTSLYFSIRGTLYSHDTAQLWSVAASTWLFYRALRYQRQGTWIALGAVAALSTLTTYSAVIQFAAFFIFMLRHQSFRDRRNQRGLVLAAAAYCVVMLPHLLWLASAEYTPLRYAGGSLDSGGPLQAFGDVASFIGTQGARLSPMLVAWFAWKVWERRRPTQSLEPDDAKPWSSALSPWDKSFLLWVGIVPCAATLFVSAILGARLDGSSGTTFFILWGFFLFWGIKGNERETLRRIAIIVIALQVAMVICYAFARGPLAWTVGRAARSTFPGSELSAALNERWSEHVPGSPLRFVASDIWLGGNVALNSPSDVQVLVNGRIAESPWIDSERVFQCGILVAYSRVAGRGTEPLPDLLALASRATWSGVIEQWWSSERSPLIEVNWAIIPPSEPKSCAG